MRSDDARTERPQEPGEDLEARLRAAYVEGAEKSSRDRLERELTSEELDRVLGRFPSFKE